MFVVPCVPLKGNQTGDHFFGGGWEGGVAWNTWLHYQRVTKKRGQRSLVVRREEPVHRVLGEVGEPPNAHGTRGRRGGQ